VRRTRRLEVFDHRTRSRGSRHIVIVIVPARGRSRTTDGTTSHDRRANPLLDHVGLLVLVEGALDALDLRRLQGAHVITHLNTKRGDLADQLSVVEAQLTSNLVDPKLAHPSSESPASA
jgi:hypothetical protein